MTTAGGDLGNDASAEAARLSASPRLFENPLLDKLSRVHGSTPLFLYAPMVVVLAVRSLEALPLHMLHHFRDPARGFGVSAPWWDYVFKTAHRTAR